jgi:microcystin-dependent protein
MAKHQASDAPKIVVLLADGTMKAWEPTNSLDNFIAYWDGVSWKIGPFASLFPSGDGVLVKNTLGGFSFVNGVAGESLQYVGANIEFSTQSFATVPTGLILPYAANAPIVLPTGYLECDGSAVSQTTYTNLFSIITTTYNDGTEPSGDFRLPDLRGYFIRGFGTNIDLTTSGSFGTKQTDSYLNHNHSATSSTTGAHTHGYSGVTATNAAALGSATNFDTYTSSTTTSAGNHSHVITVNSSTSGGTETRPRNIAMRYLIKT